MVSSRHSSNTVAAITVTVVMATIFKSASLSAIYFELYIYLTLGQLLHFYLFKVV